MTSSANPSPLTGIWKDARLNFIYTISPTHCGIGQTASSVDLPIARNVVTGFPILPATALKGVAREMFERHEKFGKDKTFNEMVNTLFGPDLSSQEAKSNQSADLKAAALSFTEGRMVAYPVRCLSRPFLHVTCPLILENLARDVRLLGNFDLPFPKIKSGLVYVADPALDGQTLVLEDLCYNGKSVSHHSDVEAFAGKLGEFFPASESAAAGRLKTGLVIIPDEEFNDLIQRSIPVVARTVLSKNKTADNLWYEEHLPPDTLFISFTGHRRQVSLHNTGKKDDASEGAKPLEVMKQFWDEFSMVQIGGNETIGNGFCIWEMISPKGGSHV